LCHVLNLYTLKIDGISFALKKGEWDEMTSTIEIGGKRK